ncbi:MAG: AmmeMemoRadiSam system radical SAM enzyme [Planctomycetes bacterium]|jgi:pyruvate formate lyase activating enzyme|nr:AmmeMemoRadiSam system radical SAM enzyme [Planctomycetota bacterium]
MQFKLKNIAVIALAVSGLLALAFLPSLANKYYGRQLGIITGKILKTANTAGLTEARYYQKIDNNFVQCDLCPNRCVLADQQIGLCKARQNLGGVLYSLVYGRPATIHLDPIEKKPLFHFRPGTTAYSLATTGCNLSCLNCQNWDISQSFPNQTSGEMRTPADIASEALTAQAEVIAFTYNEPVIFYEYMLDIAKVAREQSIKTVMISNGYISQGPLNELLPFLDGVKIDLKGFTEEFYRKITGGRLAPVLETIKSVRQAGKHLEIVYLLIPGENDSEKEIAAMAKWLMENIGPDAILHFSRFYPQYKMANQPPTPVETVKRAREIALRSGLRYVYTGNIDFPPGEATYCADGSTAIERRGYFIEKSTLVKGVCPDGSLIPGVWE